MNVKNRPTINETWRTVLRTSLMGMMPSSRNRYVKRMPIMNEVSAKATRRSVAMPRVGRTVVESRKYTNTSMTSPRSRSLPI